MNNAMVNNPKATCQILARLLVAHGVKRAVLSPGSRNAPLVAAISRQEGIKSYVTIDERAAAFEALGMAEISGESVAIVCTSGTALLNYAPAVAEAYYKKLPLIVVSADRPAEWIDQDDSQTLRQPGALANFVKRSYNLRAEARDDTQRWWVNREINDALTLAQSGVCGPVHINISIDAPLCPATPAVGEQRVVTLVEPRLDLTASQARWLATELAPPRRVMVVAGFHAPNDAINRALARMGRMNNVVVLAENLANLRFPELISRIDTVLSQIPQDREANYRPNVVITYGGALVSRLVKRFLRRADGVEHWHVGVSDHTIDCFQHLVKRVDVAPELFFPALASALYSHRGYSTYAQLWAALAKDAYASHEGFVAHAPWCDLKAFSLMMPALPRNLYLQISNGTAIRYTQLFDCASPRLDCNRGVSGIDGSTSTAVGASVVHPNVLITGDMSAQYDIGAFSSQQLTSRTRIIVMCNGGGAIFRFVGDTSELPELDRYLAVGVRLPLEDLCKGYGLTYLSAHDEKSLAKALPRLWQTSDRPVLLAVYTDGILSAEILRKYFNRLNTTNLKPS
ncbi:MAG: 2-succinyl-5-enolpyruvyl-6-hydroxy-3-cyclohexene-1-carboxylic-acid synthase [Bacteroidales bacterium]|nr:2-succinyl-5-enolpyruvyl-6-hydroxy-3-cyclohexene-1-carboxylic-acid synthase [Bacteroidales bacterium]